MNKIYYLLVVFIIASCGKKSDCYKGTYKIINQSTHDLTIDFFENGTKSTKSIQTNQTLEFDNNNGYNILTLSDSAHIIFNDTKRLVHTKIISSQYACADTYEVYIKNIFCPNQFSQTTPDKCTAIYTYTIDNELYDKAE